MLKIKWLEIRKQVKWNGDKLRNIKMCQKRRLDKDKPLLDEKWNRRKKKLTTQKLSEARQIFLLVESIGVAREKSIINIKAAEKNGEKTREEGKAIY